MKIIPVIHIFILFFFRRMRTARAENDPKLTEDRIRRLDAIGMKW